MSAFINDPVQALLAQTTIKNTLFASTSRYYGIDTDTFQQPGQLPIVYVQRRFVPPPENFQVIEDYTVVKGDRLDNIAGQYSGDPTLFWRICDANRAMRPEELTETIGEQIKITLPEGIAGQSL
jgi:nucleoid-associated protein YgaU